MFFMIMCVASALVTNNPQPNLKIKYNEEVNILDATLKNIESENYIELELVENISSMNFTYKPVEVLKEGDYTFSVLASDVWGNEKTTSFNFIVDLSLVVGLVEPINGVSAVPYFDIIFNSSENATCRYYYRYPANFNDFFDVNVTGTKIHRLINFSWPDYAENYGSDFFAACETWLGGISGENGEHQLFISVDQTIPIITLSAEPNPIIDYTLVMIDEQERPVLLSTLKVEANEDTICKYSETENNYTDMENKFVGFDEKEYKNTHKINITLPNDNTEYNYSVACENKAGLVSKTENIIITTNTATGLVIISFEPSGYLSKTSITLNAVTNKNSDYCIFYNSSDELLATTQQGTTHELNIVLQKGQHSFKIVCTKGSVTKEKTTSFTIDLTPPISLVADDTSELEDYPEKTNNNERLQLRVDAYDAESRINNIKYRLEDFPSGNIVKDWETADEINESFFATGLNLRNKTYKFKINATNNAGMSTTATSNGIKVDTTIVIVHEPTCDDGIQNQYETDVDCGGPCSACPSGRECEEDDDCASGYCHTNYTCQITLCENAKKDSSETDIDCGGICVARNKTCALEQNCNINADCTSGFCGANGKCRTDPDDIDLDGTTNEEDEDMDGDGIPNNEDPDDDNDALCDTTNSPLNDDTCAGNDNDDDNDDVNDPDDKDIDDDLDNNGVVNEEDSDMDGDDIVNNEDPDDDNDGLCDTYTSPLNDESCSSQDDDDDNDGIPDWLEEDTDNDLDNDGTENEQDEDMDGDDIVNNEDPDDDNDGLCDSAGSPLNNPAICSGDDMDDDNDGTADLEEDNDNDGIPDWWEIENGLNPFVADSNEIRTETGLTYYEEYMKELEAQLSRDDELDTDVLDEEKTSPWILIFLIFAILAVLVGGGYFGYNEYVKKKQGFEARRPMLKPFQTAQMPARKPVIKGMVKRSVPAIAARRTKIHELVKRKRREKAKRRTAQRGRIFEEFGGAEEKPKDKKEVKVKIETERKEVKKPEKEWLSLDELEGKQDVLNKLSGFIKSKDIVDELSKLKKQKETPKSGKEEKNVFSDLEKISKETKNKNKQDKDIFNELKKIKQSKKK